MARPAAPAIHQPRSLHDPPNRHATAVRVGESDEEEQEEEQEQDVGGHHRGGYGHTGYGQPHREQEDEQEDDHSDADLDEREPLIMRSTSGGSAGPTSSAISPSTDPQSLRRFRFRGPKSKRHCTDIWALALFAIYWIGMLLLALYAFTRESNVDFAKYIKDGVDFQGKTCGNTTQFVYFPDFRANPDFGFCVAKCPDKDGESLEIELPLATRDTNTNSSHEQLQRVVFKTYATHTWTYVCAPANVATESVLISQLQDTLGRFVGALGDCWPAMLVTCGVAFAVASLYLVFLRFCGCFTVFLSILGIESLLIYASYKLLHASADPLSFANDPAMKSSLQIVAIVVCCSAVLFCLLVFSILPRLLLAGKFITHASKALYQLKRLLIVPFISYLLLLVLFWYAIIVTICIFGAGKMSSRIATISAFDPPELDVKTESFLINYHLRWFFLAHVFGVYWTGMFILAIGEMITSTAVAMWYFAPCDQVTSQKILPHHPVSYAIKSTFKYHLGTLALSSAAVTPISYVRSFFSYLEDKNEYDSNFLTQTLARCCCCCIGCFNYCLKFISKEAFYITAIHGTNFYPSAKLAHTLISSNLLRIGALSQIGNASVLLGKLIVGAVTGFIAWLLVDSVSSPVLPLVAVVLFAFAVAHAFMTIYETTINMLLMCFTLDENMHGGRGNTAFANATLVRSVNDHLRPKWQTVL